MGNLSFSEPFGQNAHIPRVLRRSCDRRRVAATGWPPQGGREVFGIPVCQTAEVAP